MYLLKIHCKWKGGQIQLCLFKIDKITLKVHLRGLFECISYLFLFIIGIRRLWNFSLCWKNALNSITFHLVLLRKFRCTRILFLFKNERTTLKRHTILFSLLLSVTLVVVNGNLHSHIQKCWMNENIRRMERIEKNRKKTQTLSKGKHE
jgi:hypothetical protein